MSSLNQVNLIGRCGRDPELKYLTSGEAVTDISIATSERWKDKNSGETKEATEWHRCVFFGKLAEVVGQYVKKGGLIFVGGSIKSRKYTDRDGNEKTVYEIKCHEMKLLGSKSDNEAGSNGGGQRQAAPAQRQQPQQRPAAQKPAGGFDDDGDIPF